MHIDDLIKEKAKTDGRYAIAYSLLQISEDMNLLARAADAMGCNISTPIAGPGTTEYIGMQLAKIAEAIEGNE